MKKTKLSLTNFSVDSFVTNNQLPNAQTAKGGNMGGGDTATTLQTTADSARDACPSAWFCGPTVVCLPPTSFGC